MGSMTKPTVIRNIKSRQGKLLFTEESETTQPISTATAHIMTSLMKSVIQSGTATKIKSLKRPVAGKTGTTQNYSDGWFVGITPNLVTSVLTGCEDRSVHFRGEKGYGSYTALPIFGNYMRSRLNE